MSSSSSFLSKYGLSLISLIVAVTALTYNTWRNELTESNRNVRASGFEILREVAYLQLLVDQAFYAPEQVKTDPIVGWTKVNFIQSLTYVMPKNVQVAATDLKIIWQENWEHIDERKRANEVITAANKELEQAVLKSLRNLN